MTKALSSTIPFSRRLSPVMWFCLALGVRWIVATTLSRVLLNGTACLDKANIKVVYNAPDED